MSVTCLCLEESIESPARSGIGRERSNMGLRPPRSVQMASKCRGMQPLPCPRAFTVAVTGGAMEPRPAHTFDAFRLEPPPGGLWRGDVRLALRPVAGGGAALSGHVCRRRPLLHLAVHGRILMSLACSSLVAYARKAARLWGHMWSAHASHVVGIEVKTCMTGCYHQAYPAASSTTVRQPLFCVSVCALQGLASL
jgi:hypothetical protein